MASEDETNLKALEGLMTEFFATTTSNERKRQIEELLNNFSAQSGAWRHCFYFLAHTSNEYVMMYCLTVFENLINRTWVGIPMQDKLDIRNSLSKLLLSRHKAVPPFVRNKLVKVLVDIGRLDWPHHYPDFFTEIFHLIQQPGTTALGLIILQTTSEELACPREDLSVARKEELHSLLLQQVPTILSLLTGTLESVLDKHRQLVTTATPPPSPTHGDSNSNSPTSQKTFEMFSTSPLQSGSILNSMFQSGSSKTNVLPLPPLDQDSEQLSTLALNCLNHLFSWIPLSTNITPSLLTTIFQFASFGCDINTVQNNPSTSSRRSSFSKTGSSTLGVLAMCCINEIMSKNCVPTEFEEFLLRMFQQTFQLLQRLTKDTTAQSVGNKLAELDENYVEKFTDFLRLFVSVHLRRFEGNAQFPVLEFLALLFKYTFKQPGYEGFFACLDIWTVFIDYLLTETRSRTTEKEEKINRYKDALVSLMSEILRKLQFRFNQSQLEEMDDETLDDDCETEWQHFLRQCVEVIARVAELLPSEAFSLMYPPFQEYSDVYLGLQQHIVNTGGGQRLNITAENECRRLHCTLRDLSSLLQALGRHADHFIADKFAGRLQDAMPLVDRLCQVTIYGSKMRLYEVQTPIPTVLRPDFIEVHAQALAALQAFNQWIAQFYLETQRQGKEQEQFVTMVTTMLEALAPLLQTGVPDKIALSAAHLFLSIATSIRPAFLIQLSDVQKLFNDVSGGSLSTLQTEVQLLVCRALSNILILPWPNIAESDQQWEARSGNHMSYVKRITDQYRSIKSSPQFSDDKRLQEQAKPCIKKTLAIMVDLVESVNGEVTKTKQICYSSLQDSIQFTISIFPIYIRQPDVVEEILSFFLAVFQSLRVQMGVAFTEQAIQTFMNLFTREQLADTILNEGSTGCRIVEKFLKILQILVQEPGSASKRFLPSIITLCMDQIYPIIAERSSPDIKCVLFELLHLLLLYNWRYFFRASVLDKLQSGGNESIENQPQFIAIMQAFGQSFLQPDIAIFKQNLEALETLNTKWKLYYKKFFRELMLFQFLNVLLQVLVHKSHDLLQEEILITVYNMASVDFDSFYGSFLHQFLSACDGLDDSQKTILGTNFSLDKDLPSFTQSLRRLVNDLRYYRICNSALPEGSVKL
ncbi:exportin-6-like [Ptychodera flava]|uniref:exportin-6-like n=1 Tax=Ptychodera flava TaxID=63121 RepID=UPI00396A19C6